MTSKGISPIVSSVLVLAVAVTIASIYGGWAPDLAKDLTSEFTDDAENDIKCRNAGLDIKNADYDNTSQDLVFDLENTGTIRYTGDINIVSFSNNLPASEKTITGLDVGETRTVTITMESIPDKIVAAPVDCSSKDIEETFINVTE